MKRRICCTGLMFLIAVSLISGMVSPTLAAGFDTKILRAAAIGLLVKEASPELNKFINTFTMQNHVPVGMSTKVVPILSVGEKGYVGAAQVAGPQTYVNSCQAVWLYEDNFSNNEFRLKVYVPSASLNPLELKKVQKVGISAIIDVSLDGRWRGMTYSHSVRAGDILKAAVVAVAINTAADPLNKAINSITKGLNANTKVVPIATVGDKAYIGGAQVSSSTSAASKVKAVYQYEEIFDGGKFRIKAFVPSDSTSPLKIRRVSGVGITALIDTSVANQEEINRRRDYWRGYRGDYRPIDIVLGDRFRGDVERHDQGLHKGWYIGKGNQRKLLTGVWVERYRRLDPRDQDAFVVWWNAHYKDKPDVLELRWKEWQKERARLKASGTVSRDDNDRDKEKGQGDKANKGKGKSKK